MTPAAHELCAKLHGNRKTVEHQYLLAKQAALDALAEEPRTPAVSGWIATHEEEPVSGVVVLGFWDWEETPLATVVRDSSGRWSCPDGESCPEPVAWANIRMPEQVILK